MTIFSHGKNYFPTCIKYLSFIQINSKKKKKNEPL